MGAARDRLESLARDGWAAVPRGFDWFMTAPLLAETAAALGASERAAELYEMLVPYASQIAIWVHGFSLGSVSRYVGLAAAASSRLDEAVRRLEDAAAANEAIGARPLAAHAKADHARVLLTRRAPGDGEHARDLLLEALAAYEQLGMAASAASRRIAPRQRCRVASRSATHAARRHRSAQQMKSTWSERPTSDGAHSIAARPGESEEIQELDSAPMRWERRSIVAMSSPRLIDVITFPGLSHTGGAHAERRTTPAAPGAGKGQ